MDGRPPEKPETLLVSPQPGDRMKPIVWLVLLSLPASAHGKRSVDDWTRRMAPHADTLTVAPHLGQWLDRVFRLVAVVEKDPDGRHLIKRARRDLREKLGFDALDLKAWSALGATLDGPGVFAQHQDRFVALAVPATQAVMKRLLPKLLKSSGTAAKPEVLFGIKTYRTPVSLIGFVDGWLVAARDERVLGALVSRDSAQTAPSRALCEHDAEGYGIYVLRAQPGASIDRRVESCIVARFDRSGFRLVARVTGMATSMMASMLASGSDDALLRAINRDATGIAVIRGGLGAVGMIRASMARSGPVDPHRQKVMEQLTGSLGIALWPGQEGIMAMVSIRDPQAVKQALGALAAKNTGWQAQGEGWTVSADTLGLTRLPASWPRRFHLEVRDGLLVGSTNPSRSARPRENERYLLRFEASARERAVASAVVVDLQAGPDQIGNLTERLTLPDKLDPGAPQPTRGLVKRLLQKLRRITMTVAAEGGLKIVLEAKPR